MVGVHQILYGSRDLTTPLSGIVCRPSAGISTHYENMKGDTKCRNWDGLG